MTGGTRAPSLSPRLVYIYSQGLGLVVGTQSNRIFQSGTCLEKFENQVVKGEHRLLMSNYSNSTLSL